MTNPVNQSDIQKTMLQQQKTENLKKQILNGVLLALLLLAPAVMYPVFLMKILCFALFAVAFNLLLGFAGLLSFGHAAFLATGAYVTGYLLSTYSGLSTEMGIIAGTAASTLIGLGFAVVAIRRQGIYFAMITLALAQLVFFFYVQAPFTNGEDGLHGVPRGQLLGFIDLDNDFAMYYFVLAVFLGGYLLVQRVVGSPFGQVLKAIKENEPRAVSLGYNVNQYKLLTFVISAGLAGLAGSVKTVVFQLASLGDAHWHMSGEVVLMTLLGGSGTLLGPVVGAAFVVNLEYQLSQGPLGDWVDAVLGGIFILVVIAFQSGIVGEIQKFLRKNTG
ncbi:branched-chain amino acid ABC transporter permease [uncultured Marinobacter sp.]|jgi:branched-chain amino acid transport system permease protein|uniref:branched-chain amino acid ABC transporter permease n=1 Tax=uncultured Marinobacter sp. TaxID=187379 RepID=UPI0030D6F42C|tara:strand:- start:22597 stop:23592 length:996 start_codon:yes stop_codon:yes gene_type:complete